MNYRPSRSSIISPIMTRESFCPPSIKYQYQRHLSHSPCRWGKEGPVSLRWAGEPSSFRLIQGSCTCFYSTALAGLTEECPFRLCFRVAQSLRCCGTNLSVDRCSSPFNLLSWTYLDRFFLFPTCLTCSLLHRLFEPTAALTFLSRVLRPSLSRVTDRSCSALRGLCSLKGRYSLFQREQEPSAATSVLWHLAMPTSLPTRCQLATSMSCCWLQGTGRKTLWRGREERGGEWSMLERTFLSLWQCVALFWKQRKRWEGGTDMVYINNRVVVVRGD